jgi:hypothetical protein
MGLEEHGLVKVLAGGGDGGVEALEVAGLDDAVVLRCEFEDAIRVGEAGREGFFDEKVYACGEEGLGCGGVVDGGDADGGGMERACGGEGFLDGWECGDVEVLRGLGEGCGVGVDDGGELNGLAGLLEFAVDAEVVSAEGSGSDDGDAEWLGGGHYFFAAGASTASRQRA